MTRMPDQVEDVVELLALDDHLLVDGPEVLRAAGHLGVDAQLGQPLAHLLEHLGQVEVALGRPRRHHVVDLGVALGVQRGEGQVLELLLERPACRGGGPAGRRCRASPGRCAAASTAGMAAIVRMLWRRSASLMIRTRRSLAIATSILRMVAACWASLESNWMRSSLVTPSTMAATSAPKSPSMSSRVSAGVLHRVVEQGGGDGDVVEARGRRRSWPPPAGGGCRARPTCGAGPRGRRPTAA